MRHTYMSIKLLLKKTACSVLNEWILRYWNYWAEGCHRRRLFLVLVYREKISLIYDVSPLLTLPLIVSLLLCPFHCYRVIYGSFLQRIKFISRSGTHWLLWKMVCWESIIGKIVKTPWIRLLVIFIHGRY